MFQTLSNSWALVKASAKVLRADKELLVFPILSTLAALLVTATFFVPAYTTGLLDRVLGEGEGSDVLGYIVLFLFYVCQYTVTFYFNTALVGAALIRLQGGDPTAGDGFRIASRHFGNIVGYAVIAATVGMVIKLLMERAGRAGQVLGQIGGLGWTLATFLVVPVLVAEGLGPMGAVKRSAQLLKKTWGEQIVGGVGMGAVFFAAFLLAIVLGVLAIVAAASTQLAWLIVLVVVLFVLTLVLLGLIQGALSAIYAAAVYRHAEGESSAAFFPPELVEGAFRRA